MKTLMTFVLLLAGGGQDDVITTETMLQSMVDLDKLTAPANYTCEQFSSYDRAAKSPTENWFANGDRGKYLRVEPNGEHVLAEAEGPGAIVRMWSANPAGILRVYLDGNVVLETDFGKITHSGVPPFVEPFGGMRARGCNLYFPFPYAKSMKVTTSEGKQYYHVNYLTFPKGTKVETYSKPPERLMAQIASKLKNRGPLRDAGTEVPFNGKLELEGPGTITCFEMTDYEGNLRDATIKMTFDGEMTVWSPLGDFFGTAPDENLYKTLPMGTWYCNFPMPFDKSAKIEVEGAKVEGVVRHREGSAPFRFYAWWRGRARIGTRPMYDWPILRGKGRGRFVGCAVYTRNPVRKWWGEGDEKIYYDGQTFPSTFGTGTEDYFGYAWCDTTLFDHAYHSQSRVDGPANAGSTAVNRFHVIDDIPFTKDFRFDMEIWHWDEVVMGYASIAYWYAEPGFQHDFSPAIDADRRLIDCPEARKVIKVKSPKGAIEGEGLKVIAKTGDVSSQGMDPFGESWSGNAHLWWTGCKPGDQLSLQFESKVNGNRKIYIAMTKAPDYGIFKISVNRKVVEEKVDLFAGQVEPTGEIQYSAELREGVNELLIECVGINPSANPKNHMFGLDYLRIE